jgi:hypothetical protein
MKAERKARKAMSSRFISSLFGSALIAGGLLVPGLAFGNTGAASNADAQFQDLRNAAQKTSAAARKIVRMEDDSMASWGEMRAQIRRIVPQQEALVEHLNRLDQMKSNLTASECQALNEVGPAIQRISNQTRQLNSTLHTPNVDVQSPSFAYMARTIQQQATLIGQAANVNAPTAGD